MIRKTLLVSAAVAILMGATAAALLAQAFTPPAPVYVYSETINRPAYMKGKLLEACLEYPVECTLIAQ